MLREGVEAALLIAALLGIATQAGLGERKRWVHAGWGSAVALGIVTWILSTRLIAISGASREMIEGVTAILATLVLFYVSYSLLAKKEVARWMKFLRGQVSPRRAAISLFGVSFLAAYREAFETVLFYQTLLSSHASTTAALAGILGGGVILVALVAGYSRAGRFAPPQVFFRVSSYLLYALAVIFAGQGVAALQLTGLVPIHALPVPIVPALGLHPTVETCAAQGTLILLAVIAFALSLRTPSPPKPVDTAGRVRAVES
jgi:high-affinity iron transporter